MFIQVKIFGIHILDLTITFNDIYQDYEEGEEEEEVYEISGGQGGYFERDPAPLNPDDRYDWEFYDRRFGFQAP